MPATERDFYVDIIALLETPQSAPEMSDILNIPIGSIYTMLSRLIKMGAVSKELKNPNCSRPRYYYTRNVTTIDKNEVLKCDPNKFVRSALRPTVAGARVIDFSQQKYVKKLHETSRITNKERRSSDASIGSSFNLLGW